jgi:hypothetical protein
VPRTARKGKRDFRVTIDLNAPPKSAIGKASGLAFVEYATDSPEPEVINFHDISIRSLRMLVTVPCDKN